MICWMKLIGGLLVWKKRTVITSPSLSSPTCNPRRADPPRNAGKVEFAA